MLIIIFGIPKYVFYVININYKKELPEEIDKNLVPIPHINIITNRIKIVSYINESKIHVTATLSCNNCQIHFV